MGFIGQICTIDDDDDDDVDDDKVYHATLRYL